MSTSTLKGKELVEVEFVEPWRGYAKGDRAKLKDYRAEQLLDSKICKKAGSGSTAPTKSTTKSS